MIAAISLMRRRDDVPLAQFRRHWLDVHGPLVCRFAGLRRYVQCHVIASPVTNAAARAMRIDGFPILFFNDDADRRKAHGSAEMAACNVDSRLFIGAVARVMTETEEIFPATPAQGAASALGTFSMIALYPDGCNIDPVPLRNVSGLRCLVRYHLREQGPAPNSTVPYLSVTVGGMLQARFDSLIDLECALADWSAPEAGVFVVEEHWLHL